MQYSIVDFLIDLLERTIVIKEFVIIFVTAIATAYITTGMQRFFEKKKKQEDLYFEIYMKLMELNIWYLWLASAEIKKEKEPRRASEKVFDLKWQVADAARKLESGELNKILEILFLEKFSYRERHDQLSALIDQMGYETNPKYRTVMKKISDENLDHHITNLAAGLGLTKSKK